jgi:membrane protein
MVLRLTSPRQKNDDGYGIIYGMTERAMKPKQPLKRKKTAKTVKTSTPQPNSAAEAAIFIGSLGIIVYAIFVIMRTLLAIGFSRASGGGGEVIGIVVILFGVNIALQSMILLKEARRVDHYSQRIVAIYMVIAPLLLILLSTILAMLYRGNGSCIYGDDSNIVCVFINKIHSIKMLASKPLFIVSVMGSLYLWFLLRRKDKLFWIYDESSKNKIANEKTIERAESFRRVGITLMTIPVVLYAIKLIVAIGGYNGIEGDWLQFTMLWVIDYFFASMIWVPFVIAGLIFFVKSK